MDQLSNESSPRKRKPRTIRSIVNRYVKANNQYWQQRQELEEKLKSLQYPHWMEMILKPIVRELKKQFPDRTAEILGPFGICSEVSIHLTRKGISKEDKFEGDNTKSLCFTFHGVDDPSRVLYIRDYRQKTNTFAPGTLGDINGMNFKSVAIPDEAGVEWLLQFIQ